MKECEKYAALLDAFSEGDLFLEDMVQVQNHLMNCPDCQAYLEDLLAIRAAFPTVEDTEVPEGFAGRVMAAVAEHPRTAAPAPAAKPKKTPWRKLLVPLAACCALVILLGRTAVSGGSSAPAAKFSAQTEAATEECAAEEPKAKESAPAETADAAEDAAAAYNGSLRETAPEPEMAVNDSYSYTAETKAETVETTVTTETAEEVLPEAAPELILTAAQAGDLLKGFTPAEDLETELRYELTAQEYVALLAALPREVRQSAPANAAETMTVVVLK